MKNHFSLTWRSVSIALIAIVIAQFFSIIFILDSKHHVQMSSKSGNDNAPPPQLPKNDVFVEFKEPTADNFESLTSPAKNGSPPQGVAATVMLKAPKWFHRRYTLMIHNVLANIPSTWSIQIFSNEDWIKKDVLPLHPGLQRLRSHPRIIWTAMPKDLTRKRPKEIMKNMWLWESIVAEDVLFFTGNGVLCANSKSRIEDFLDHTYVGVPWKSFGGVGGDGSSHSFRKRSHMMRILEKYPPESEMESQDYHYFAKYLSKEGNSKLANVTTTILFGGVTDDPDSAPFAVSGTQANLEYSARQSLLQVCPELGVIFPSLHEPSCFGAHPNGEKCKASICALQDPLPSSGC